MRGGPMRRGRNSLSNFMLLPLCSLCESWGYLPMESSTAALGVSPHVAPTVRSKLHPRYKYYIPDAGLSRPATLFHRLTWQSMHVFVWRFDIWIKWKKDVESVAFLWYKMLMILWFSNDMCFLTCGALLVHEIIAFYVAFLVSTLKKSTEVPHVFGPSLGATPWVKTAWWAPHLKIPGVMSVW